VGKSINLHNYIKMRKDLLLTKPTKEEFIHNIIFAFYDLFKTKISKESACLIYAKFALETGYGKNCYNYNLGNIKENNFKNHYVCLHNVWEIENGVKVVYQPPHPQTWFRCYENWHDGMKDYLNFIYNNYKPAWEQLMKGEPEQYVRELKKRGYFTGNLQEYILAVCSIFRDAMKNNNYDTSMSELKENEELFEKLMWKNCKPNECVSLTEFLQMLES